jgi:hypothetical protein
MHHTHPRLHAPGTPLADASWKCPTCGYSYQYRRLWWADILGSQITLVTVFLLIVCSATYGLGYIPLVEALTGTPRHTQPPAADSSGAASTAAGWWALHLLDGVAVMGLLGVLLSLSLAGLRACGLVSLWWLPDAGWCPMLCLECNGGGLGWAPLECAGAATECAALMLIVLVLVGFVSACYMLYHMLYMQTQAVLEGMQSMVENVHKPKPSAAPHSSSAAV